MAACQIFWIFFAVYSSILSSVLTDADYEGALSFTLEHAFESGSDAVWTKRGTINLRSLKPGRTSLTQSAGPSQQDIERLVKSAKSNGIYRIRIPVKPLSNGGQYVSSFTLACALYESRLSDFITVNLDQSGMALAVSIFTYPGICSGRRVRESELTKYNSTVEMVQAVVGPIPDTQAYIEKMKKEEMERAKGQQPDNRPLYVKYWMYIVPGVFIILLMNVMDPQGGGGGR